MILLWDVVSEVVGRIGSAFVGVGQVIASVWYDVQGAVGEAMQGSLVAVVGFGNNAVNTFEGAYGAIKAIWGNLPGAIGDFAYQAANALIAGVEAMLNAVVSRINGFIGGLNAALDLLPDWATGGEPLAIGLLDPVALGRIENQFAGAAARAGEAAKEAFRAAFDDNAISVPDLGLEDFARAARQTAEEFRESYQSTFARLTLPLESWEALRQAMVAAGEEGEAAFAGAGEASAALTDTLEEVTEAAAGAGAAGKKAGEDSKEGADAAKSAWQEVSDALAAYAAEAMDKGKQIGGALVNAFKAAEDAFVEFVTTGKLDFKSLANSILADITRIAIRQAILGPLANALSGVFGGGGGGLLAGVFHDGGMVGQASQTRAVPALAFAGAPRYHNGGIAGLRPDEVPAILQRGERVLSRREVAAGVGNGQGRAVQVVMNISTPDANSFRLSQGQIMADARRALGRAGRNS
jgi:lambda family phage tail tape measure protein